MSKMNEKSKLIVMLTKNDLTVKNARDIFEECKDSKATMWGFKEAGLPLAKMKLLFNYMKSLKKETFLEVVAYSEEEGLLGAKMAKECHCDYLIGTNYFDSINKYCQKNNIKYMPYVGIVNERPSILSGDISDMIKEANNYLSKGVYGVNLLGYRYNKNQDKLIKQLILNFNGKVCLAGSIDSYERLNTIKKYNPWAFTIGSAFFDNKFDGTFLEQVDKVIDYVNCEEMIEDKNDLKDVVSI
jgi:hypothetical protein